MYILYVFPKGNFKQYFSTILCMKQNFFVHYDIMVLSKVGLLKYFGVQIFRLGMFKLYYSRYFLSMKFHF